MDKILVKLDAEGKVAKYPYTYQELRKEFPLTSFTGEETSEELADFQVAIVHPTEQPEASLLEEVFEVLPTKELRKWKQTWQVVDADDEVLETRRVKLVEKYYNRINTWKNAEEQKLGVFPYGGTLWDGGLLVQHKLELILKAGANGLPAGFFWTSHDNTDVPFSFEDLTNFYSAHVQFLIKQGWEIHAKQRQLKKKLEKATILELMNFRLPDEE